MENCHVSHERFKFLIGLIAIAYTIATDRGTRVRRKKCNAMSLVPSPSIGLLNSTVIFGLACTEPFGLTR